MKFSAFPQFRCKRAARGGIEPLESRIAPALASPFPLGGVDGANGFHFSGLGASGFGERPAAGAGDVNGDGFADVIFGASGVNAAFVVFGKADGFPADLNLTTLDGTNGFRFDGTAASRQFGQTVGAAGDVNGDGFADVVVGAFNESFGANAQAGAAYVIFGKASFGATFSIAALNEANGFKLTGTVANDQTGSAVGAAGDLNGAIDNRGDTGNTVSGGGDVNGDGFDDIVIGAPYAGPNFTYPGASYVVFGKRTSVSGNFPADFPLATLTGANGFKITGESTHDYAGRAVLAGDVNGDGLADVLVGAIGLEAQNEFRGGAYVIYGNAAPVANVALGSLDGVNGVKISGARVGDQAGRSVAGAGDFNGDGKADLLIGADSTTVAGTFTGSAFLVSGASLASGVRISPDGKTASYIDVDGDRVILTTSRGAFVAGDFTTKLTGQVGGLQLQTLDLSGPAHAAFAGANFTMTATRSALGGDGFVNVGYLNATGTVLGAVRIEGDLGQIDAAAVTGLAVQSLGRLGTSTQAAGGSVQSDFAGQLGGLLVKSDVVGAFLAAGDLGAITIGGALRGGAAANSGALFATGDIGVVRIGQGIIGGAGAQAGSVEAGGSIAKITLGNSLVGGSLIAGGKLGAIDIGGDAAGARIFAKGTLLPANDARAIAIESLLVRGTVRSSDIFAGYDRAGAPANADAQIGAVVVTRDWIASDLVAGVRATDAFFGNADDAPSSGGNAIVSRIASILIAGQALGTLAPGDHFGFVAEAIGSFAIGATVFPLTSALGQVFAAGATGDLRVRET